ncbi:MAG TPA: acyltransferase [Thermomicrobiales bacterium]|nr:acyltransferase [Thermomicrobiales bacterium]
MVTGVMLYRKSAKLLAKYFPLNGVRVRALRAAGYRVGRAVTIGEELQVTDDLGRRHGALVIGDRVAIAQRVMIILTSHPNASRLRECVRSVMAPVVIHDDAWVGAGAIILPGVTIGELAIVGAGSVVTRDVPPRTVVAGNPARVLKSLESLEELTDGAAASPR